jgi:hypothetical protein
MEILIIGLIIVALMAYTSTKIKKAAREAFEPETVSGEGYSIAKPEGYMLPGRDDKDAFEFEIVSKEFGSGECGKRRRVSLTLNISNGDSLTGLQKEMRSQLTDITEDELLKDSQKTTLSMAGNRELDACPVRIFMRSFARNGKIYRFEATATKEDIEEHEENIRAMFDSIIIF